MSLRIYPWSALGENERRAILSRPATDEDETIRQAVVDIINAVRQQGDQALRGYALRFENARIDEIEIDAEELAAFDDRPYAEVLHALEQAAERIRLFHEAGRPVDYQVETAPGVVCRARYTALRRVGLYIPAGTAPLISTLAMLAVPAQLAGCEELILCSPPQANGECSPLIIAAARRLGVRRIFRCGGAQAIAAMAYGTASVPRCDKIFGPGNRWVTEAKRQVSMDRRGAAIDMPAGPSEVLVIADAGADPDHVALDLLSQAEHGGDSQVLLVSLDDKLVKRVNQSLAVWLNKLPRAAIARRALDNSRAIIVDDSATALAIANEYAPEHLIIQSADAEHLLAGVRAAGSVFLGPWTPESLGDYCSGTNHVLPTAGLARSHSGLSLLDFMKRITIQQASAAGLQNIGPVAATLAASEGLDAHRLAVTQRLRDIPKDAV